MRMLFVCVIALFLQSCSHEPEVKNGHLQTVRKQTISSDLFYTGSIEPLKSVVITSPADGTVVEMVKQYGEHVKAGDLLFVVSSAKFLTDYKNALMQYIKAKNDFNNSKTQLAEGEFLHTNELISDDDYKMKKSSYYSNRLVLLQAKDALQNLLKQLDIKDVDLYNLSIADIDKITKAMHMQKDAENLRIHAPADGVLLSSIKKSDDNKKATKGDTIKQGDVLGVVGDMHGITVNINVNELTINQLRVGQPVTVTGIAFPDDVLKGKVTRVDKQGEVAQSGVPTFAVEVAIDKLTSSQQKLVHAGMSAKVQINLNDEARMMIPVAALIEKSDGIYVKTLDKKSNKLHDVKIVTGKSTIDSVAVLSGLSLGDKIVIPNQA